MEDEVRLVETRFHKNSDDTIFSYKSKNYSVKSCSFMRALEPTNFDYTKQIGRAIETLEKSGRQSMHFSLYAALDPQNPPRVFADYIEATFLMPGYINQVFKLRLDPSKQDLNGKIGLKVDCVLRRVD